MVDYMKFEEHMKHMEDNSRMTYYLENNSKDNMIGFVLSSNN
jgi:hypothetical protein